MRINEAALFIERNRQRTITGSDLHNGILSFIFIDNKINHRFCISFTLVLRNCRNVFYLQHTISFIGYNTLALNAIIIKNVHPAPGKITIYHIFLLIR